MRFGSLTLSASLLLAACGPRPMVSDQYKSTNDAPGNSSFDYRKYVDSVYNAHDPEAIDRFFTSDVVVHGLAPGVDDGTGTAYLKDLARGLITAFPDVKLSVDEVIREGDKMSARVVVEGTHKGEFLGLKPTGRKVKVANFAMYRLRGDKIAEVWSLVDIAQMRIQLTEAKP